jgi:PhzF family phenazine biosynthesis protein
MAMKKDNIKVFVLNAFAKTKTGGNPAGVVLDADTMSIPFKQKLAAKVGFSETAFVQRSDVADFKISFFTPTEEVALCGHATIAAFSLLNELGRIPAGCFRQETKAGILGVEVQKDGTVFMEQTLPSFKKSVDRSEVAQSLGIRVDSLVPELAVQIVSTGLRDIMVPVATLHELFNLKPDFEKIAEISKKHRTVGFHVFTQETKFKSAAHCRNFAPLYGIPEEAATGTSSGALACYLFKHGKIAHGQTQRLVFEQGYCLRRPSEIIVRLDTEKKEIRRVQVGGKATAAKEIK